MTLQFKSKKAAIRAGLTAAGAVLTFLVTQNLVDATAGGIVGLLVAQGIEFVDENVVETPAPAPS
jgi:hypothetical protein